MAILIGDIAPDFEAETSQGHIHFYDYIEGKWAVLFSHPKNFTPVCTTELGTASRLKGEFEKRGVKLLGLSVDKLEDHGAWSKDIHETQGVALNFPLLADADRKVSNLYGMIRGRLAAAGVVPAGKRGPHVFRHARAVEMLRASVPQKIIGDVLGHRSTESTNTYLKLATDDLRAVALDVPGMEVLS